MLTDNEHYKIEDHIKKLWKNKNCLICESSHWIIHGKFFLNQHKNRYQNTDKTLPLITVICNNCGNTLLFNIPIINKNNDKIDY